jgi:hypothetical protein
LSKKQDQRFEKQTSRSRIQDSSLNPHLPVLGNVKRPLELQVSVVIIVNELGDSVVVTTSNHAGGSLLLVDWKKRQNQ